MSSPATSMVNVEDFQIDEAEYRVGTFLAPTRTLRPWPLTKSSLDIPVSRDAAQRMRDRGLANDDEWAQDTFPGTLAPQGIWRTFLAHAESFQATAPHVTIRDSEADAEVEMRITAAKVPQAGTLAGLASSERFVVPADADDTPLAVDITWQPVGVIADDVIADVGRLRNGRFTVHHGPSYCDREDIDIVDGVASSTVESRIFGRSRTVTLGADALRRVLRDLLLESARSRS